jgi:hypothetical protein
VTKPFKYAGRRGKPTWRRAIQPRNDTLLGLFTGGPVLKQEFIQVNYIKMALQFEGGGGGKMKRLIPPLVSYQSASCMSLYGSNNGPNIYEDIKP